MTEEATTVRCSFCGKSQDEVRTIIAGPNVHICDECVDLCNEIIFARAPSIVYPLRMAWRALWSRVTRRSLPREHDPESSNHDIKAEQR